MPPPRLLALLVAGALWATGGCTGDTESPSDEGSVRPALTLEDVDPSTTVAQRGPFCAALPEAAVADALAGRSRRSAEWGNGDRATLAEGVRDVAHEFGCRHRSRDGTVAEAWVFAPPVDRTGARRLVQEAAAARVCEPLPEATPLGSPSVALACEGGGQATASYRGLLGDGWLVCRIATGAPAPDDLAARADRWCAAVLQAVGG